MTAAAQPLRVTVWQEHRQDRTDPEVIAGGLREQGFTVRTATLDQPECGLPEALLAETDVLTWRGHQAHADVTDAVIDRVHRRVVDQGMGLIVLHSAHYSHPITAGLDQCFEIPQEEMYGERFDIPAPDALVFIGWFQGREVFRSGCCYHRGCGKVFYFQPGHETYPIYYQPEVRQVIANGVRWTAPSGGPIPPFEQSRPALERLDR